MVSFEWRRAAKLRSAELSAWDWKPWDPSPLRSRMHDEEPIPGAYGEHYAHDARRVVEHQGHGPHLDYTGRGAADVHERQAIGSQTARGRGNVLAFQPGRTFELEGHRGGSSSASSTPPGPGWGARARFAEPSPAAEGHRACRPACASRSR